MLKMVTSSDDYNNAIKQVNFCQRFMDQQLGLVQSRPCKNAFVFCPENPIFQDILVCANFCATWCRPCREVGPMLEKLSDEFEKVLFLKVSSVFGAVSCLTYSYLRLMSMSWMTQPQTNMSISCLNLFSIKMEKN